MTRLDVLYPDTDSDVSSSKDICADIVLVHGLGGHYINTWKADDETLWPRDLLPRSISRKIRVHSLEYGGSIQGTTSKAGIDDVAQNLLQHLVDEQNELSPKSRPIILVGHSLGGIIIKRAIRVAYNNSNFKSIKNAIFGVMFFATPHKGDTEEFGSFLLNVLKCNAPRIRKLPSLKVSPTPEMVKKVTKYPGTLEMITGDFVSLLSKLSFATFQEEHNTKRLDKRVVEPAVGKIGYPEERDALLPGDHLGLCRFKNNEAESRFEFVSIGMTWVLDMSPKHQELLIKSRKSLSLLCSDAFYQSMTTEQATSATGDWIFQRPAFEAWLNKKSGKSGLWISGRSGCGKTYLASYIIKDLREKGKSVICAFLCESAQSSIDRWQLLVRILQQALNVEPELRRQSSSLAEKDLKVLLNKALDTVQIHGSQRTHDSHPRRDNVNGLLAATVRQMMDIEPDLIELIPKYRGNWTTDGLTKLWKEAMKKSSAEIHIVIDGFDKMERQCQQIFLNIVADFRTEPGYRNLKLLLLSDEYSELKSDSEFYEFARYTIGTDDTQNVITATVNNKLDIVQRIYQYPPKICETIREGVPKAANGIHLRADLMLESLKRREYSEGNIQELFLEPSDNTAKLYDHILGKIWEDEQVSWSVKQVLPWIVFQQEGLTPAELSIARALSEASDNAHGKDVNYDQLEDLADENTELWVNRFCGDLVRLENGRFELVHPSLRKYLTTPPDQLREDYGKDTKLHYHTESFMDAAENHERLGNLCAAYLTMDPLVSSIQSQYGTGALWRIKLKERMKQYKFFRYAALHWSEHLKLARDLAVPPGSIREFAVDKKRHKRLEGIESWAEVACYFHDWHEGDNPELCSVGSQIRHGDRVPDLQRLDRELSPNPPARSPTSVPAVSSVTSLPPSASSDPSPSNNSNPPDPVAPPARQTHWFVWAAQKLVDVTGI